MQPNKLPHLAHAWLVCHRQKRRLAIPAGLLHGHLALYHCQEGLQMGKCMVSVFMDLTRGLYCRLPAALT